MKKRFFGVMLAASLAVSLTACGGKKTSQDNAASTVNKEVTAEEYAGTIENQLKKLGISCDWDRERFTMDEGCSKAVEEVFINLYNKGYIYKGSRIINWCPKCKTSLSDAEVEH